MPDHREWRTSYASLHAGARCLGYLVAAVAGLDVAFGARQAFSFSIDAIGLLAAIGGCVAFIGTLFRRWQVELVAVFGLTAAMLVYTVIDWLVLVFVVGYPPLSLAAIGTASGVCVVAAVATGRNRFRWAAVAGAVVVIGLAVPLSARNPAIMTLVTCLLFARSLELKAFGESTVRAKRLHNAGPQIGA